MEGNQGSRQGRINSLPSKLHVAPGLSSYSILAGDESRVPLSARSMICHPLGPRCLQKHIKLISPGKFENEDSGSMHVLVTRPTFSRCQLDQSKKSVNPVTGTIASNGNAKCETHEGEERKESRELVRLCFYVAPMKAKRSSYSKSRPTLCRDGSLTGRSRDRNPCQAFPQDCQGLVLFPISVRTSQ